MEDKTKEEPKKKEHLVNRVFNFVVPTVMTVATAAVLDRILNPKKPPEEKK